MWPILGVIEAFIFDQNAAEANSEGHFLLNMEFSDRLLEKLGYKADVAANGKEAVKSVELSLIHI